MKHLILTLLVCLSTFAMAQHGPPQGGRPPGRGEGNRPPMGPAAVGMVVDESGNPVPYAAVALFSLPDSMAAGGAATNEMGRFRIEAKPGDYYAKVSFLAYKEKVLPKFTIGDGPTRLGQIQLESNSENLDAFDVVEERAEMELKLDKRVFNIDKNLINKGANAAEVLDNIPSVTVDVEGNVSLRGSENVRILIDGKPSGLVGISAQDALRQLQGDMVEKVEVITNPSARYDAEGEVGIINIVLKKEKRKGMNGSITVNAGYPTNYGLSFNVNVRRKKYNVFASYGASYRRGPGGGSSFQEFTNADTTYSFESESEMVRGGLSNNFRVGTDIDLNDHNRLTVSGMYRMSGGTNNTNLIYRDFNALDVLTQTVTRKEAEGEEQSGQEVNLSWRKTFKQKDRSWTADASYIYSDDIEDSEILEVSTDDAVADLNQRFTNDELQTRWLFQTDYVHPFGKEGKFETGARVNLRTIDNDYTVEELASDAFWNIVPQFDNHLVYTENIYAAYVMAGNKTGNLSYQLGLRTELSDITTELKQTNEINARDYLSFFPTAHFSYELKKKHFIQLSYSRRLSRPRHWWLLPFFSFSNPRNFHSGNPNLDPEFTHALETAYLKQWEKGSLMSSLYYRYTTGKIERVQLPDTTGFTRMFPINLSTNQSAGLEFSGNYNVKNWWTLTGNYNFFRSKTEGEFEGASFDADTWVWTSRFTSKWNLNRKYSWQTSYMYRSPRLTTQGRARSMMSWDAGAAMDVMKGNGTLSFSVRDLLNTRRRRTITDLEGFYSESDFQWRQRQFVLSFNYRINQKKRRGGRPSGDFGGDDMM